MADGRDERTIVDRVETLEETVDEHDEELTLLRAVFYGLLIVLCLSVIALILIWSSGAFAVS